MSDADRIHTRRKPGPGRPPGERPRYNRRNITLPRGLDAQLEQACAAEAVAVSAFIADAVKDALARRDRRKRREGGE